MKQELEKIQSIMSYILNKKNIEKINFLINDNKFYCCFNQKYLSNTNQLIIMTISKVYSDNFFYSNNINNFKDDRFECWIPDEAYDEKYKITEQCKNKEYVVLELEIDDILKILGTTIMLANTLREQDPLALDINKYEDIFTDEDIARHEHYLDNHCPDLKWLNLNVTLDENNPLRENPYAPINYIIELNDSINCDNVVKNILSGFNEKEYLYFNMDIENLKKVISEFMLKINNTELSNNYNIQKLLKNNM